MRPRNDALMIGDGLGYSGCAALCHPAGKRKVLFDVEEA
jgi:hypothetical protein